MLCKWCNIIIWIFFMGKLSSAPVLSTNRRWPTVGALITNGLWTGGDDPFYNHRLKSNAPQTGGDAHFKPAVIGGAVVVRLHHMGLWQTPPATVLPLDSIGEKEHEYDEDRNRACRCNGMQEQRINSPRCLGALFIFLWFAPSAWFAMIASRSSPNAIAAALESRAHQAQVLWGQCTPFFSIICSKV